MSILIQILHKHIGPEGEISYVVSEDKTIEIGKGNNDNTKNQAMNKLDQIKSTLNIDEKIRVLEYHNDDSDESRQGCKVLYEE